MTKFGYYSLAVMLAVAGIFVLAMRVIDMRLPKQPDPMRLVFSDGHCTGSYLGNGYILTANHCLMAVQGEWKPDLISFKLDTVWTNTANDIAVLRNIDIDKAYPNLPRANFTCEQPVIGEAFTVAGYPSDLGLLHVHGYIAGKARKFGLWDNGVPVIVPTYFGNSGGPAYNSRGQIFAIVVGVLDTPISVLSPLSTVCGILPR